MAERIVERLIRERDTRYGDGIYTTTQIQFAWNSNHMEGSTLTAKQTAQLFATGTYTTDGSEQVNPDDALETRNHFAAFRWILDHADEPVDRDMVCHLHAILKQGTRQVSDSLFNVGGYKTRPNFIGNPVTPTRTALPQDVPEFMDRLFDMCTKLEDEPYRSPVSIGRLRRFTHFRTATVESDGLSCSRSFCVSMRCLSLAMTRIVRSTSMASASFRTSQDGWLIRFYSNGTFTGRMF